MICIFTTSEHQRTLLNYLERWSNDLKSRINPVSYDQVDLTGKFPRATYVIADLERLSHDQLQFGDLIFKSTREMGNVVFNNPSEVLRKFDLLRALHLSGMNKFNVYRPGECPQKWPVFVRPENEHGGDSFVLCHSQSELDGQISELVASGKSRHSLIVTEFVDAADGNGIIRTYSILKIGDHWIPRHLFLSRNWVTRHTTIPYDDWVLEEEKHFDEVLAHSHLDQVKQVFDLAHIGYGRIDYAIVDGEIQVWEINTNPMLLPATKKKVHPQRMERTLRIARQISQAFNEIDTPDLVVTANPGKPYNTIEGGTSVSLSTHAGSMLRRRPSQASTTRQPLSRDS